jgi:kynureninase
MNFKSPRPLGEPYPEMTDGQKEAWEEFRAEMPWLRGSHRIITRLACMLTAKMNEGEIDEQESILLAEILTKMGV